MPTVTNVSSDNLNMPTVGGLSLDAGETKEVDDWVAAELVGHPLLRVDGWAPAPVTAAEPIPEPEPVPESVSPASGGGR